ncbi:two-component system, response regulator YesN [Paenibacillus catalpae]|uniref:Two-component system, response regulator YesN n=1 Tax=Paenibacillus catalpae TaxID=1045775 RepID=A0A1I2DVL6_9BACL|nr:response regulator [Paenibacillus catalpae]SFE84497.1 two-component system, response regulator YesN [Paenibacillus catalpae]
MYRVLIIDDEEPLREAIRILGDWKGLGVSEVLEATDGKRGLELIAQQPIDLVMVDMKMPGMSGAELLQVLERDYPDLPAIVISGYNDFEYTRQAIRSKVVDYLLKPINRHDLNAALRKAVDLLEARRVRESEFINRNITLNMSLPKLKEKMYLSIIDRSFRSQTNEAFLPLIGADDPDNRFAAVVLRMLNMEQVRQARFHSDVDLLHFAVGNMLNEIAGEYFQAFSFASPKQDRELIVILTMKGAYQEDIAYRSLHQMNKALAALQDLLGIVAVAGIGTPCSSIMEIANSYEMAKAAINGINLLKLKGYFVTNTAQKPVQENPLISGRIQLFRAAIEAGNTAGARSILSEALKRWSSGEAFTLGEAEQTLNRCIVLLNDMSLELGVPREKLPLMEEHPIRFMGLSDDFTSFEQFSQMLDEALSFYLEQIRLTQSANRPFEIGDIKAYIDNRYYEDIKISMFADKYFLSREYIMKLFKQQFGCGIHEYVQRIRMAKAKELLDDPSLKIQDISEMLGYKDKNYFSKAFRNYFSISPTEYRTARKEG